MKRLNVILATLLSAVSLSLASPPAEAAKGNPSAPKGGVFYLNSGAEPPTLNPINSREHAARLVSEYVMESLLGQDEDTHEWMPALAEKWEVSKDGKTYTFKLRQGVTWSDGKPLTAEDVKFSFDAIFDPKYEATSERPYYEGLEKLEIVDPKTIKITAKEKYFRNFESAAGLTVVPKHIYGDPDKGPKLTRELVGSGPYKLESFERGKGVVLKRNDKWWGNTDPLQKGQYNYEAINFKFAKEQNVAFEMLKKGEFDFQEFDPETYTVRAVGPEWGTKVMKVKTENLEPKGETFIGWNQENPLFKDKKVRRALAHLINRELMNEKFRYGMSLPATGPWYQQSDYASKTVKPILFDPKKAAALLKEAGWTDSDKDGVLDKEIDGKRLPMKFTILNSNPDANKYLTMYKEDARKVGVDIDIKVVEWTTFNKLLDERKFDAVRLGWVGGGVDVDPKQVWHSASIVAPGSNFISYKNPQVDKLIDEARGILDKKKRIPLMRKVYELIADDAPYAFMFNEKYVLYGTTARIGKVKDTYKYVIGRNYWWIKP